MTRRNEWREGKGRLGKVCDEVKRMEGGKAAKVMRGHLRKHRPFRRLDSMVACIDSVVLMEERTREDIAKGGQSR